MLICYLRTQKTNRIEFASCKIRSTSFIASLVNERKKYPGLKKNLPSAVCERKQLVDPASSISLTRQAELLEISRSSMYTTPTALSAKCLTILHALDEIFTKYPIFGTRRMRVVLRRDYGIEVGRDAVRSAMQTLGLSTIYPKKNTSMSHPEYARYPYLLRGVKAQYPNITYIRLEHGFCYLCVMLDWFSRKVIAWQISDTLHTDFCIQTLEDAFSTARPDIHNSDQGSQFTSEAYIGVLKTCKDIRISMDGRGRCFDNIFTERLWRSVKYEDVYLRGYQTIRDVRNGLTTYFDFYNSKRPHQSLNYKTPNEICSSIN